MGSAEPIAIMEHFRVLEFDLHDALLRDLIANFEQMIPAKLNSENVDQVNDGQGVYQLFFREELVCIGKTDREAGLRLRLQRHCGKVRSRVGLNQADVSFKAVQIYVFTAMDLEGALIRHYKGKKLPLSWNLSGFGSNDPGRERDNSRLKINHFDSCYPIDLEMLVHFDCGDGRSAASILKQLKDELPFTIRYQSSSPRSKTPHAELINSSISLPPGPISVRTVLIHIASELGREWQVTALPGHVIIYREERIYDHGVVIR
ncbi:hypothetical protein [Stenotrophomonas rhizophila]|uniref:hypothetical protein n=1 Tax=Stenotrophomonas rhizophila TaxID=216778 RepID=UPI003AF67CB8